MKKPLQIVILAAGHGKRMGQGDLPKVLVPFEAKPIILYLLESIAKSGVDVRPIIVVGQKAEQVKKVLGSAYDYVYQAEQLGTGHALAMTEEFLRNKVDNILVLYGDHPLISSDTIKNLVASHQLQKNTISMATAKLVDFNDWRQVFLEFGRIVRDGSGKLIKIIEKKDASEAELKINEVNPGYYCFKAEWLWDNLAKLNNDNKQREYYLTDLVALAIHQDQPVNTIEINPTEALGVNTPEQLTILSSVKGK